MNRRKFLELFGIGVAGATTVGLVGKEVLANTTGVSTGVAEAMSPMVESGPVSYYTGSTELNPPLLRCPKHPNNKSAVEGCNYCKKTWYVAKGFPRKHR